MTTMAPEAVGESLDPRDPLLRLSTFFDDDSVELLHERDRSGVLAAAGTVNGVRTIAFCTDGTVMGGAMGLEGCTHIVNAYDTAIEEQSPIVGIWHSGGARLAEGVRALHAVGSGLRGHDPGVRLRPADLGGRRLRRRRRRLRARADRRHHHGAGRPGVRHRARRGAQRHRRGRGHGLAGRPGHPPQEVRGVPHRRRRRARRLRAWPPAGRIVLPAGTFRPQQGRGRRHRHPRAAARIGAAGLRRAPDRDRDAGLETTGRPSTSSRPSGRRRWWSGWAGCPAARSACWPTTRCG